MSLSARKFLSISTQLGLQACNIIQQFSIDKNMKKYEKGHDDHVTQADYKVQSMLIKGFKLHFPELKIIGEQTEQFKGIIDFNYTNLKDNFLLENVTLSSQHKISQCCLWIDPIDCTKGFIQGNFQDVTVLVGMSVRNLPSMGMIGIPFKKIGSQRVFQPQILIGSISDKHAYKYMNNKWEQLKKQKPMKQFTVTTSNSRSNSLQDNYVSHFNAKNIHAGGSGRKIALVIKGEADLMAYIGSATCKWDSCAGDSIIKAMGGKFTTPLGNQILYNPNQSIENKDGIFCSLNQEIHSKSIQYINNHHQSL